MKRHTVSTMKIPLTFLVLFIIVAICAIIPLAILCGLYLANPYQKADCTIMHPCYDGIWDVRYYADGKPIIGTIKEEYCDNDYPDGSTHTCYFQSKDKENVYWTKPNRGLLIGIIVCAIVAGVCMSFSIIVIAVIILAKCGFPGCAILACQTCGGGLDTADGLGDCGSLDCDCNGCDLNF